MDCLCLKIIAKGKVAQHLKESAVSGGFSDILNIAGTDALLAGGNPSSGRDLLTGEVGL